MESNATGKYVGSAGTASGNLTITNPGVGYTPSSGSETYNHVSMVTKTGNGRNGTLNLTITGGVAVAATVVNGGTGYQVGDVVGVSTVGLTSLGKDIQFSIASITGTNEFILMKFKENLQQVPTNHLSMLQELVLLFSITLLEEMFGYQVLL